MHAELEAMRPTTARSDRTTDSPRHFDRTTDPPDSRDDLHLGVHAGLEAVCATDNDTPRQNYSLADHHDDLQLVHGGLYARLEAM